MELYISNKGPLSIFTAINIDRNRFTLVAKDTTLTNALFAFKPHIKVTLQPQTGPIAL